MKYILSEKYSAPELMAKIMGPNPIKLEEELMQGSLIPRGATVCDLGRGQGLTRVFLAQELGLRVLAADLWREPEDHTPSFEQMGVADMVTPVKADATALPFEKESLDAVVSTDSYHFTLAATKASLTGSYCRSSKRAAIYTLPYPA